MITIIGTQITTFLQYVSKDLGTLVGNYEVSRAVKSGTGYRLTQYTFIKHCDKPQGTHTCCKSPNVHIRPIYFQNICVTHCST